MHHYKKSCQATTIFKAIEYNGKADTTNWAGKRREGLEKKIFISGLNGEDIKNKILSLVQ